MKKFYAGLLMLAVGLMAPQVQAADPEALIRARLKAVLPEAEVTSVKLMPVEGFPAGLYQVTTRNYEPVIVTGDGRYMLQGDLLEIKGSAFASVTDQMLAVDRSQALAKVKLEDMVIFPATGKAKRVLYVFTDVDCGYCRKFHEEVPELNQRGVEVRYLAFPRGGTSSPVAGKLSSVWCAKDRQRAMTDAKRGTALAAATALCKNPVNKQYDLGTELGVRGTPAIFSEDGMQLGGYVPAEKLAKTLQLR